MSVIISSVEEGSIAQRRSIQSGYTLHRINGKPISDVLDYRFYMVDTRLTVEVTDEKGQPLTLHIRKDEYDDLGLEFETYLMDKQHTCTNNCIFCFVHQMPPGMRDTLYFKDDDSRMSFLFGNYVTLTNLKDADIDRIIKMRISPINISVHTTDPVLRQQMMHNRFAGKVLDYIPRLTQSGIRVNTQLVLCPGYNDGEQLAKSLNDLGQWAPELQTISAVPVGVTRYREGLPQLTLYTPEGAGEVIDTIEAFSEIMLERHGQRIAYAADEFYLQAGRPIPSYDFYGEFNQLENGVGLIAMLDDEFAKAMEQEDGEDLPKRRVTTATGTAAFPLIQKLANKAQQKYPEVEIQVVAIRNDFFGDTITVAGLVTGTDLIEQLKGKDLGDELLIPTVMLRHEQDKFLDDVTVEQVEEQLGCSVRLVENEGFELLDAFLGRKW